MKLRRSHSQVCFQRYLRKYMVGGTNWGVYAWQHHVSSIYSKHNGFITTAWSFNNKPAFALKWHNDGWRAHHLETPIVWNIHSHLIQSRNRCPCLHLLPKQTGISIQELESLPTRIYDLAWTVTSFCSTFTANLFFELNILLPTLFWDAEGKRIWLFGFMCTQCHRAF